MLVVLMCAIACIPLGLMPTSGAAMAHLNNGELHTAGKVIDAITDDQRQYYGFDIDAFGAPPAEGCVMMLLSSP